jgi:hypothetical protein
MESAVTYGGGGAGRLVLSSQPKIRETIGGPDFVGAQS